MEDCFEKRVWQTLSVINVNGRTEKKNGLTYLSWAWAWGVLMEHFPQSSYHVHPLQTESDGSVMVSVTLTIREDSREMARYMWLPVMNHINKAIPNPNSVDINKAIMRCLTKAISMCGLGFYIYAGEDFPEEEKIESAERTNKRQALIKSVEQAAKKGTGAMKNFWTSLSPEDMQLVGEVEKQRIYKIAKGVNGATAI